MPGKLKPPSPRLASKLNLQKINGPIATSHKDVDPRICGLIDAVRRGWYRLEKGELFIGFKVTKDDIVLDVGCGEGNAILNGSEKLLESFDKYLPKTQVIVARK